MKILITLTTIYFLTMTSSFAAPVVGKVLKARGKVTALFPGGKEAVELKKGMSVREDTSLLSANGSFAQIQMNDGSRLVLGPKSKMVIKILKFFVE